MQWHTRSKVMGFAPEPQTETLIQAPAQVKTCGPAFVELYHDRVEIIQPASSLRGIQACKWVLDLGRPDGFKPADFDYDHGERTLVLLGKVYVFVSDIFMGTIH